MTTPLIEKLNITSSVSIVIISISLMLFGGFAMTRITKRLKLPNVTAYIVAGILMGPYCLNLIPVGLIERISLQTSPWRSLHSARASSSVFLH